MKFLYSTFPFLILISLLWVSPQNTLQALGKTQNSKGLSAQEDIPQKYSSPTEAVKTFFTAFKDKDFDLAWESLSVESQNRFIQTLASRRHLSLAQSRELFEKSQEPVRLGFWNLLRDRSKIVPLVQDATYKLTDEKGNKALVEMKSGGITHHIMAVKEGNRWRAGYVESALQDDQGFWSRRLAPPESAPREEGHSGK